jgi:hypothetical protein
LLVPLGALLTYAILSITIGLLIFLFRKKWSFEILKVFHIKYNLLSISHVHC